MIKAYVESGQIASVGELHRDLSIFLHGSYVENREGLERLAALLQVASGLLTIEVALWITAIAGTV